jgi:carbamate kinase
VKIVVSIDGDLLLPKDVQRGIEGQKETIAQVVCPLGELIAHGYDLVITHGNSGQVGFVLFRAMAASHIIHTLPLDICGADTQGATGYMLQQELNNWLAGRGIHKPVSTIITQAIVEKPELSVSPAAKGIGPFFDSEKTHAYQDFQGWDFRLVPGHGYQRLVPCLRSTGVVEAKSIRFLVEQGVIVICAGGGGIPVIRDDQGVLKSIEAVSDKAFTAALLAREIGAQHVIFISPWERIAKTFDLAAPAGYHHYHLTDLDSLIDSASGLEETMLYKLEAIKGYIHHGEEKVWMLPPSQLEVFPQVTSGVEITA